jgi:hypothetical protein
MNVLRSRELLEGNGVLRAGPDGSLFDNIASECNLFAYFNLFIDKVMPIALHCMSMVSSLLMSSCMVAPSRECH